MKLSQHINYSDANEALIALTKVCFKSRDERMKSFRDDIEKYLNETECNTVEIKEEIKLIELTGLENREDNIAEGE